MIFIYRYIIVKMFYPLTYLFLVKFFMLPLFNSVVYIVLYLAFFNFTIAIVISSHYIIILHLVFGRKRLMLIKFNIHSV